MSCNFLFFHQFDFVNFGQAIKHACQLMLSNVQWIDVLLQYYYSQSSKLYYKINEILS